MIARPVGAPLFALRRARINVLRIARLLLLLARCKILAGFLLALLLLLTGRLAGLPWRRPRLARVSFSLRRCRQRQKQGRDSDDQDAHVILQNGTQERNPHPLRNVPGASGGQIIGRIFPCGMIDNERREHTPGTKVPGARLLSLTGLPLPISMNIEITEKRIGTDICFDTISLSMLIDVFRAFLFGGLSQYAHAISPT